ncbi:unnamed protein product [Toxocara canis]|uniref:Fibronectin type-III domain-containing protein n=1 Tax=Toxocara canis TaxID=6265 RepID=A0A183UP42_TOXCA|nr:unnamed protein product [Toxocara canis]
MPRATYIFKMQAVNVMEYEPLSPISQHVSSQPLKETLSTSVILANHLYAAIGTANVLVLVLLVIITAWYMKSKNPKSASASAYVAWRKSTTDGKGPLIFGSVSKSEELLQVHDSTISLLLGCNNVIITYKARLRNGQLLEHLPAPMLL